MGFPFGRTVHAARAQIQNRLSRGKTRTSVNLRSRPTLQEQSEKFKGRKLNDLVYECVPTENPDVEIVFFHGLQLPEPEHSPEERLFCWKKKRRKDEVQSSLSLAEHAFWRTWKMRDSENFWPETLLPTLLGSSVKVRVLCVAYEGKVKLDELGNETSDQYLLAESLRQDLIDSAGVGRRDNVPVFLVGHDLGGILIKSFVISVEDRHAKEEDIQRKIRLGKFLSNLRAVFFFATPHSGSKAIEEMAKTIPNDTQNLMLRLMSMLNAEMARINEYFREYRLGISETKSSRIATIAIHPLNKTMIPGRQDAVMIVQEGSARSDVDQFLPVSADHYEVCQPVDEKSSALISLKIQIQLALNPGGLTQ